MLQSLEVDIYPLCDPRAADLIDGALGDGSQFHVAFGYYAHGVGLEPAEAPAGWQERLVKRDVPSRPGSGGTSLLAQDRRDRAHIGRRDFGLSITHPSGALPSGR
jgi:hypothetical protein